MLPNEVVSHGLPPGQTPDGSGTAISLLAGNLGLTEAVLAYGKRDEGKGMAFHLRRIISNSNIDANTPADIRQFNYSLLQHNVIDNSDDKKSNISFGQMQLIGYRLNM